MRIAMIGSRGIPASWGGVERHVEELSARMVERGHEVVVYTRPNYVDPGIKEHRGVELRSVPTIGTKHLDAAVHCLLSSLHAWGDRFDIVHYHAIGPSLMLPLARLRGFRAVSTIHAQDWQREKWSGPAKAILKIGEWNTLNIANESISVSETLANMYMERRPRTTVTFVPNGVALPKEQDKSILDELGLEEGEPYLLFAGRMAPEKGLHYLLEAWERIGKPIRLVVAGDTSFTDEYVAEIRKWDEKGVLFSGYVYGEKLAALFRNSSLFVLPSDIEGYPIVLLESQGHGAPMLASDIPQNIEAAGGHAVFFKAGDVGSLSEQLEDCIERREELKLAAMERQAEALAGYDWDNVVDRTMQVYERALKGR